MPSPRFAIIPAALVFLISCGSGGEDTPTDGPVAVAPTITAQPTGQSVVAGQTATFTVTATGTAPLTYQWKKDGGNVGTNSNTHTTPITTLDDDGAVFTVVVSNAAGSRTSSNATLTVTSDEVAPTITTHPANQAVTVGQTATFSVTAAGTAPLVYQWKKDGANVGTNSHAYTTPATTLNDDGAVFTVVVSNGLGEDTSNEAVLTVNEASTGAIVINHTNTDLSQIPSAAITAAKTNLKIAYGHTSHGSQLITGMDAIMGANALYAWNESGSGGALKLDDYAMGGDVGYYPAWVENTRSYLGTPNATTGRGSSHTDVNVILWSWCGQASSRTQQEMIDTYLTPMSQLEGEYPGIKFVYMTGHLDGSGASGNLHLRNQQIRAYCQANNKILFDFNDIECYAPGGTTNYLPLYADDGCYYDSDGNQSQDENWATNWIAANPSHELTTLAASCGDCAHSQTLNCIQKGRAAWWLWARIAGWDGN